METLARTVDDNGRASTSSRVLWLVALVWIDDARGVIAGLTRYATRDTSPAVLEAIAFQVREVFTRRQRFWLVLDVLRTEADVVN